MEAPESSNESEAEEEIPLAEPVTEDLMKDYSDHMKKYGKEDRIGQTVFFDPKRTSRAMRERLLDEPLYENKEYS